MKITIFVEVDKTDYSSLLELVASKGAKLERVIHKLGTIYVEVQDLAMANDLLTLEEVNFIDAGRKFDAWSYYERRKEEFFGHGGRIVFPTTSERSERSEGILRDDSSGDSISAAGSSTHDHAEANDQVGLIPVPEVADVIE